MRVDIKELVDVGINAIEQAQPGMRVIVIVVHPDEGRSEHAIGARRSSQRETAIELEAAAREMRAGLGPRLVTS